MKKSLLALAVLGAFSSAAFAQSSVTLFGIVDTGFSYYKGDGNGNVKAMTNSGLNSSRLGVRGSEDLGGGLKANFWLEAAVNTDNGTGGATNTNNQASGGGATTGAPPAAVATNGTQGLAFGRRMFVGLSGGFGEIRLGRNYTPIFMQITSNDPFGTNGAGQTNIENLNGLVPGNAAVVTNVRASNAIEYLTPAGIGGVYVHLMGALGENASVLAGGADNPNENDGRVVGGRVGWAGGPADISLAYNRTTLTESGTQGNYTIMGIGGTLTFGAFKPMFQYVKHKIDISNAVVTQDPERDDWLVGIVASFGALDVRAAYNNYNIKNPSGAGTAAASDDASQISLGLVYNLSRRTAIYGTIAQVDNKSGGRAFSVAGGRATTEDGGKSQGLDIGIRHSF